MKASLIGVVLMAIAALECHGEDSSPIKVEGEPKQTYFLIDQSSGAPPEAGYKLLLVLPGGDGSADFLPFVTRIGKHSAGEGYLIAQLVAIKWTPSQQIIWPTSNQKVEGMEFSTEEFIGAVIKDVSNRRKIDHLHIYTLSWSSSGPAAYAASLNVEEIKGSFVAMSVFKPRSLPMIANATGHRYYIYHSPDDRVCPMRMAKEANELLSNKGAVTKLVTYAGGHGWRGNVFAEIRSGLTWLRNVKVERR